MQDSCSEVSELAHPDPTISPQTGSSLQRVILPAACQQGRESNNKTILATSLEQTVSSQEPSASRALQMLPEEKTQM